ncbi:hypothetical protein HELRODRAFT_158445 [Helobdella robusta]|uniref:GS catalytic domain-containing protein n=1 Tax=Helobdella robusta TaxID=6412 RepID=T1EMS8_HELRO|nr:hypothetical protein HELRODRAFT_158445 [Helobdella robusta]ESO12037.1 hypothetical protein HELRODRAFT_158445 [Helobdella robusta]
MSLYELANDSGVEFILFSYGSLVGECKTCLVPTHSLQNYKTDQVCFSSTNDYMINPQQYNFNLVPDVSTFIILPWKKTFAWILCNISYNGKPFAQCPRTILQKLRTEALDMGYLMKCGFEPEFTLLNEDGSALADPLESRFECNHHQTRAIMSFEPFLTEVHDAMHTLGWAPYMIISEASPCQYEINFNFFDVLLMADRMCFLKFMIKEVARKHGFLATFMPMPFQNYPCANGLHTNMSIWKASGEEINLLPGLQSSDDDDDGGRTERLFGLSKLAYNFIAGLLSHVEESCAIVCPTVNSYKRLKLEKFCSNMITWGGNDKTVLLRVPNSESISRSVWNGCLFQKGQPRRAVVREPICSRLSSSIQADLCNTSTSATTIAESSSTSNPNFNPKTNPKSVPESLLEALQKLESSEFLREKLGTQLVDAFVELKKKEWRDYSAHFTKWEKEKYWNC